MIKRFLQDVGLITEPKPETRDKIGSFVCVSCERLNEKRYLQQRAQKGRLMVYCQYCRTINVLTIAGYESQDGDL